MNSFINEFAQQLEEMWTNRNMEVPNLSDAELSELPNIIQLISFLQHEESMTLHRDRGWENYKFLEDTPGGGLGLHPFPSIHSSDRIYVNNIEDDKFIVNRLDSGRFCFKPNLSSHRFLFRGQNQHYPQIVSSFGRKNADEKLLSNIQIEDFIHMLRTHPLFMLFEHGIHLSPMKKPFFFEMNYYGLAQHYNFNTGLVDFTSDIYAAAFFATTTNKGDDKYEIYNGKSKYGVIYVHKIIPQITFSKLCSFRTIGHQIYPRTGAQHGFFYQEEDAKMPVEKCVIPYFFRHDSKCSEIIFNMMKQGEFLFPTDDLSSYSNKIRHSNSVTGQAFCNNLYTNQDDMRVNMRRLKELGVKVDWHNRRVFTIDTLNQYYENIRNGWWEEFCNKIAFVDTDEKVLMESLLSLPKDPYYSQYFNPKELDRLHYISIQERDKAIENRRFKEYQRRNK